MAAQKISVAIPADLLGMVEDYMKATGRNRSQVVAECIRMRLTSEGESPAAGIVDAPSRTEFEELDERVRKIERVAENQGAL